MKVKLSNSIKNKIPEDMLQECLLLSYATIPLNGLHIIKISTNCERICYTHTGTKATPSFTITRRNTTFPKTNETVCIFHTKSDIYIFTLDELQNMDC